MRGTANGDDGTRARVAQLLQTPSSTGTQRGQHESACEWLKRFLISTRAHESFSNQFVRA